MAGEWRTTTLQEFCRKPNGGIQTGPFGSQLHRSDYIEIGVPVIMPTNIQNGRLDEDGIARVSEAMADRLRRHRVRIGDIIFSRRGEVDKCAVVTDREVDWLCGTGCLLARVDPKIADPRYIGYHISLPETRAWLRQNAVGLVMPNLNTGILERIPIHAPDRQEQAAIADLLASLDAKIDLNRQMAATLEEMARALFKSWFVDFDPVYAKAIGRDTGLPADVAALFPDGFGDDALPLGWQYKNVLELAHWVNGAAYKNMHFVDSNEGLPVVKIAELKSGLTKQTKFTNTDLGRRYKIFDGELLFSWSGSPETSIDSFIWMNGEAWLNQHIFAVRENGEASKALHHAMLKYLKPRFVSIARDKQTTGLGHVTKDDMKNLLLGFPPTDTLFILTQQFEKIFCRHINVLAQKNILEELRMTLLPKLLSGELRADDAADSIAAA